MNDATPGRRAFLTLVSRALLGAGAVAITPPDRVPGGEGDAAVVTGRETFDRLVTQAREHRWAERLIGERTGAIGMALRHTPFVDNEDKRVVRLITRELPGAARFTKRVSFMSAHPEAYRQLKANPALVRKIARVEADINAREMHYLPKEKIAAARPLLMTGDIVGITTTIDGLDCAHAGLCYREGDGALRLLHASTTRKAVTLDEDLATYLAGVSTHTGIMVARPLEAT